MLEQFHLPGAALVVRDHHAHPKRNYLLEPHRIDVGLLSLTLEPFVKGLFGVLRVAVEGATAYSAGQDMVLVMMVLNNSCGSK